MKINKNALDILKAALKEEKIKGEILYDDNLGVNYIFVISQRDLKLTIIILDILNFHVIFIQPLGKNKFEILFNPAKK